MKIETGPGDGGSEGVEERGRRRMESLEYEMNLPNALLMK